MRNLTLLIILAIFFPLNVSANETDTIRTETIEEVVVRANSKETAALDKVPSATSIITTSQLGARGITKVKQISTLIPNFFIPDYGSPFSTPIYIRGVGTRGSGQSVGIYVDNVPLFNQSTFDMELADLRSVNILRGPQGTLYGRNAMGGVINIYTPSPLDFQGSKLSVGVANYDTYSAAGSHYSKIGQNFGIGISAYYNKTGGYFTNTYTNRRVDARQDAGARLKLDWRLSDRWRAGLISSYEWTDGGAFAYGLYDKSSHQVAPVDYNDRGSYGRQSSNNSLHFQYKDSKVLFTSTSSYQWLSDNMHMDQDFTRKSIFTINQRQRQNAFTQEFALRSMTNKNYQWSVGAYGFYNDLTTIGNVDFGPDGVKDVLQKPFDQISIDNPNAPKITIADKTIANPGTYKTPSWGAAIFHQSTFNNVLTEGLSFTVGMRLDYERQELNYDTKMAMNLLVTMPARPPRPPVVMPFKLDTTLQGNRRQQFFEYLPRVSIKYECTPEISTWITASKGHRAGGYNVQMFSEVSQNALKAQAPMGAKPEPIDIDKTVSYAPEITWNYEAGTRGHFLNGTLNTELAIFYMDIRDLQLTQFIQGGSGRILTNAGRGESYGLEASIGWKAFKEFSVDANYGYTHATFKDYNAGKDKNGVELNYAGRTIPYTPRHTFSLGATYNLALPKSSWLDGLSFSASYSGAGSIYWTEANDIKQPFYGLLDARVSAYVNNVRLEIWGRNLLNEQYGAFYFESFNKSYMQLGRPMTFGAKLIFTI